MPISWSSRCTKVMSQQRPPRPAPAALVMHKSRPCVRQYRYKHVPGVIHIKRDDLVLKHRPWHTMLRSCVSDHSMMKYSKGIYKHMPGGLESLPSFFAPKPVANLCQTVCKASKRGRVDSQETDTGMLLAFPDPPSHTAEINKTLLWMVDFLNCRQTYRVTEKAD